MFILIFILFPIHLAAPISNQEDLSISNYSHIGCLILKPEKEFLQSYIQEKSLLPYQTFSSSNMTIQLCFRLCRRWLILIDKNSTNCVCLYTINKLYELNEHLGEILSVNNCISNNLQIYSMTKDSYILPLTSPNYDWSFDGCYYLHGIQTIQASLSLNDVDYVKALDSCRKHCQLIRNTSYFSFFLSLKRSCYCLPIKLSATVITIAVRKPVIHCSFISYIKNGFDNVRNYSDVQSDTVVKIDVQRYCSSPFIFDRNFYLCLKLVSLDTQNTYLKMSTGEICIPMLIKTYEQWNHLLSYSFLLRTRTFIWIDRNSTYIFEGLFKDKNVSLLSNNLCIVLNRTDQNRLPSYNLVSCSRAYAPGYTLCAQKPLETIISDQTEFKILHNEQQLSTNRSVVCPPEFVLFDRRCYFVPTFFVYNNQYGERFCANQYSNSTLVKFDSHEWGNINSSRFLGRSINDVLLEFFYYQLEQKLLTVLTNNTSTKHWLRLLLGNTKDQTECILRYFTRSSGAFTTSHQCNYGGHPVCQCEPISINETINNISQIKNESLEIETTTKSSTMITTLPILSNSTDLLINTNETIRPICDNCTPMLADEDLFNNETNIEYKFDNNTLTKNDSQKSKTKRFNYQPILMFLIAPLLALILLIIGIIFLIPYVRRSRGSYNPSHRTKNSSTTTISNDIPNTPAVLYTRLKSPPPLLTFDTEMSHPFDNSIANDDNIELLPHPINQLQRHDNIIREDEEEPLYATLNNLNEK